jgi:hypothetical protein
MTPQPPYPYPPSAQPGPTPQRPWYKKKRFLIPIGLVALFMVAGIFGGNSDKTTTTDAVADTSTSATTTAPATTAPATTAPVVADSTTAPAAVEGSTTPPAPAPTKTKPVKTKPAMTTSQEQAVGEAEDYLSTQSFSRLGLIQQLSSSYGSGFPKGDAIYAVDHIKVNWNEQAVKTARDYLSEQHFSRLGLIQQLSSSYGSQFTHAQAVYAVNKVGL